MDYNKFLEKYLPVELENKKDRIKTHEWYKNQFLSCSGRMAELVDALGSGLSARKSMGVQVPLRPPVNFINMVEILKLNY